MFDMTFKLEPEIICGLDTVNRAGAVCAGTGGRALIVTEKALYENKAIERLIGILNDAGVEAIVFDDVPPNATAGAAETAASLAQGGRCSAVIGFGSQRTQAAARIAAIIARSRLSVFDFLDGVKPSENGIPYIAIPVMPRDPFCFSSNFIAIDPRDHFVRLAQFPAGLYRAVILDGSLPEPVPAKIAPFAAFEGFCTAIEAYCSTRATALSSALLEQALVLYGKMMGLTQTAEPAALEMFVEEDTDAFLSDMEGLSSGFDPVNEDAEISLSDSRVHTPLDLPSGACGEIVDPDAEKAEAGLLLGIGCAASSPGIGTALVHVLDGRFPVLKSCCSAILLPGILERLTAARPERIARAAFLTGVAPPGTPAAQAADIAVQAVRSRLEALGSPLRLREFNLALDRLVPVAERACILEFTAFSPWTVSREEAYGLLKEAF